MDKNRQKVFSGCCLGVFTFFALICLVMHFSFAGLMIFLGTMLMTAGAFASSLQMLLPCGAGLTAIGCVVEFVWYLVQSFQRGFRGFFLLFPILEGLLMIAVFIGMIRITMNTKGAKAWGICISAAAFAAMLLVVGTAFAGHFTGSGEVNYFVFLERMALIPLGFFFGGMMEGEEPILTIDLKKDEEDDGPVIRYAPAPAPTSAPAPDAEDSPDEKDE